MKPLIFSLTLAFTCQTMIAQVGTPPEKTVDENTKYLKGKCEVIAGHLLRCELCDDKDLKVNCKEYRCAGDKCTPASIKPDTNEYSQSTEIDEVDFAQEKPDLSIALIELISRSPLKIRVTVKNIGSQTASLNGVTLETRLSNQSVFGLNRLEKALTTQNWPVGGNLPPNTFIARSFDFGNVLNLKDYKFLNLKLNNSPDSNLSNNIRSYEL